MFIFVKQEKFSQLYKNKLRSDFASENSYHCWHDVLHHKNCNQAEEIPAKCLSWMRDSTEIMRALNSQANVSLFWE